MLHILASDAGVNPVNVEWLTLVTTVVVFLFFFGIAAVMVWPKILAGLDERDQKFEAKLSAPKRLVPKRPMPCVSRKRHFALLASSQLK